ncbi:MAG: formylglycine-generating enzyme family protein [Chloroflexia bacterium]|nr:formylglycine-generating enzyme family protein [Chloroflexia bacterium]
MRNPGYLKHSSLLFILLLSLSSLFAQSDMILVEGGSFMMGRDEGKDKVEGVEFKNELPRHQVKVSSFYIGKYEVTVKEYKEFIQATGGNMPPQPSVEWFEEHPDTKLFYPLSKTQWWGWKDNYPMHNVNWYDAINFCNWKSEKEGLKKVYTFVTKSEVEWDLSANGYRLPTEAEWEYAARGGNKSKGYRFAGSNDIDEVAWYDGTSKLKGPSEVGTKKPNELGIYDMSGNVWEWCNDYYSASYYSKSPKENPTGPEANIYRALRSGGWHYRADLARIADRDGPKAGFSNYNYGFRLAKNK